jgi:hypothetical protein
MNTTLLRKISDTICKNASKFDMGMWGNECGTTMCIAGWAIKLSGDDPRKYDSHLENRAKDLLGLTEKQVDDLFYAAYWPQKFSFKFSTAKTNEDRVMIAAERIEHLIKTGL